MRRQVLLLVAVLAMPLAAANGHAATRLVVKRVSAEGAGIVPNPGPVAVESGYQVTGTVTDNGYFPIAGSDTDTRLAGTRTKLTTLNDNTDANGAYQLVLPAGVYDITASSPAGQSYACATARSVVVAGITRVPNLVLPRGYALQALCKDPQGIAVAGVDINVDSLPRRVRLEMDNDKSDSLGNIRVTVSAWKFRVTLSPPAATKLIPVRYDSIQVTGPRNLGTVVFPRGHWVSGTVVDAGTGQRIVGANLDFIRLSTGLTAVTPGDVADSTGSFRVVTDTDLYRLRVVPPDASCDTLVVESFRSVNDTTITVALTPHRIAAAPLHPPASTLFLGSPWPNPAHGEIALSFGATRGEVEVSVLDLAGRRITSLYRGAVEGTSAVRWRARGEDGRPLPSGVYLIQLTDGHAAVVRRAILVR